ncbi:hypothetical protein N7535_006452 [Penicillium sp. DV-2018c]|nr:hypothetical protein N7461_007464 [Penicillium sp. DV-2018c]KAJ5567146.1 hypothetical protein N7535_006452 [Penicillium sp. DV-2018c]
MSSPQPPPVPEKDSTPNKEPIKIKFPRNTKGPVIIFIARASNLNDHPYPNVKMTTTQMQSYLRALLVITVAEHRKRFGNLSIRPHKMHTIIHPTNQLLSPHSDAGRPLTAALEEARENKTKCIFVLHGWDCLTTERGTIAQLCDLFRDVPLFLHVYACRGKPREFYQVNAHIVNAYLKGVVALEDEVVAREHSTALFIRVLEALPVCGFTPLVSVEEKAALSMYDDRFVGDGDDGNEPELAVQHLSV